MPPFSTRAEDFGTRILTQPTFKYITVAEFDKLVENQSPLANVYGSDTECLYVEVPDLLHPEKGNQRIVFIAEYSPTSKWSRWVESWSARGRAFDGLHPESHDGEYMWLARRRELMGKYGMQQYWVYDGIPSPEEVASIPQSTTPVTPTPRTPTAVTSSPSPVAFPVTSPATSAVDQAAVEEALLVILSSDVGTSPIALVKDVRDAMMSPVPAPVVAAAREKLTREGRLRTEDGMIFLAV